MKKLLLELSAEEYKRIKDSEEIIGNLVQEIEKLKKELAFSKVQSIKIMIESDDRFVADIVPQIDDQDVYLKAIVTTVRNLISEELEGRAIDLKKATQWHEEVIAQHKKDLNKIPLWIRKIFGAE